MVLGPVGLALDKKLRDALAPAVLSVIDESDQHAGHAGAHAAGESHFRVKISAEAFRGLSRVQQHRKVNEVLVMELKTRVHALALETSVP
jgi:BolA family transcriptional regulator, general stress-responsive regulator